MKLCSVEHVLNICVITFGWVQQQTHPKVMTKMVKKCSTDQRFIQKRNTTYKIGTLIALSHSLKLASELIIPNFKYEIYQLNENYRAKFRFKIIATFHTFVVYFIGFTVYFFMVCQSNWSKILSKFDSFFKKKSTENCMD